MNKLFKNMDSIKENFKAMEEISASKMIYEIPNRVKSKNRAVIFFVGSDTKKYLKALEKMENELDGDV